MKIISFDKIKFPFNQLIIDKIRTLNDFKEINNLDELHLFAGFQRVPEIEKIIYDLFVSSSFHKIYSTLCEELIDKLFAGSASYQKIPSVRIQMPNMKSVNFHSDRWYGHGDEIKNFWLPLVNVDKSMSLAVLNDKDSENIEDFARMKNLSLTQINEMCIEKSTFLNMKFGEIFLFHSKQLHGTILNNEKKTRLSFDFRIRLDGKSSGEKDHSFFLPRRSIKNESKTSFVIKSETGIGYFSYAFSNKFRLSQKYQQYIIKKYAEEMGINILALETEIKGFNRPINLEDILYGTRSKQYNHLIIFSAFNLPSEDYKNTLITYAQGNNFKIHFVAEDEIY